MDVVKKAQEEIDIFESPSAMTSGELISEVLKLRGLLNVAWDAICEAGYEDFSLELKKAMEE